MISLKMLLMVGLGGAAGAVCRYLSGILISSQRFPFATLFVNILGSFIIGVLFAMALRPHSISKEIWLLTATGFCGGFTTLSAFSVENFQLLAEGKLGVSLLYITATLVLSISATWLGYKLFHSI